MNFKEIRETVVAFQKSRVIISAFELDIFTFLGKKSFTAEAISQKLNLNKNGLEKLLNALASLKLVNKENDKFSNFEDSYKFLSKESPEYLAGLMHSNHLWDTWSNLTEVVKTGNVAHPEEINERGDEWLEAFINAMHDRGIKQAPAQVAKIDLENIESVLDVGGGSGCFSMEFLKRKPKLKTVIFDLPNVVPIARKIIEKEGYSEKIKHYKGNFVEDDLPPGFDLVFLSAIIHSNSYKINQDLIKKCYNSLNVGGKIVIQDWIMNHEKTEPLEGAIFAINMLVGVAGGDCYSETEVGEWLKNAGFSKIKKIDLDRGLGQMIAEK